MSKKTIIIIAIVLILALLIVGLILLFTLGSGEEEPQGTQKPQTPGGIYYDPNQDVYDPNAPQYTGEADPQNNVTISGFGSWTVPPKVTKVQTNLQNPSANAGLYDMSFEVRLVDDSEQGYEVLYTSGLVKAGNALTEVTFNRGLEKGTYDAFLHVQPYTADEYHTALNNSDIAFKLIVK